MSPLDNFANNSHITVLVRSTWLFMLIVLLTAPFFPGKGTYGFYSVEWSFFFFAFFYIFAALIAFFMGVFPAKYDPAYCILALFFLCGALSIIDTPSRLRAVLFLGQLVPYYFVFIVGITLIRTEVVLDHVLDRVMLVSILFSAIVLFAFIFYRDRSGLNDFLLNNTNIAVNKILTYFELPFCVAVYRLLSGSKSSTLVKTMFFMGLLSVVLSGSRGSLLIVIGIIGLCFLKSRRPGRSTTVTFIALVLLSFGLAISPYTSERIEKLIGTSGETRENAERFSRFYTAMIAAELLVSHPVNGVGMGNLSAYSEIALQSVPVPPAVREYWGRTHIYETVCSPMKWGAEVGVIGFILYFVFFYKLYMRIKTAVKQSTGKLQQTLIGLQIYVIASFMHNLGDLGFYNYYCWIYYGIVFAASNVRGNPPLVSGVSVPVNALAPVHFRPHVG